MHVLYYFGGKASFVMDLVRKVLEMSEWEKAEEFPFRDIIQFFMFSIKSEGFWLSGRSASEVWSGWFVPIDKDSQDSCYHA